MKRKNEDSTVCWSGWDLGRTRDQWMKGQGYPKKEVFLSDYYRGPGNEAYHRMVYNYWRAPGAKLKVLDVALPRWYAIVSDHYRREKK